MKEGSRAFTLAIAGYETVMEGADMRAVVLTLDRGQCVPWHYHSSITDAFVCLRGPMVVETRAPRMTHVLNAGERCAVPPMMEERPPGGTWAPGRRFENWVMSRCWLPAIMIGSAV